MKFEKITLWTCTETYGARMQDGWLTALNYIIPALREAEDAHRPEFKLLDSNSEDYELIPKPTQEGE